MRKARLTRQYIALQQETIFMAVRNASMMNAANTIAANAGTLAFNGVINQVRQGHGNF
jgi:hypothetical protein